LGGFILITGLHSVIPYHSNIFPLGQIFVNNSNTLSGAFSAQTTQYFKVLSFSSLPQERIIFKNVGVAVRVVAPQCLMRLAIILASFGSGV
jgi:hypothetical protein